MAQEGNSLFTPASLRHFTLSFFFYTQRTGCLEEAKYHFTLSENGIVEPKFLHSSDAAFETVDHRITVKIKDYGLI